MSSSLRWNFVTLFVISKRGSSGSSCTVKYLSEMQNSHTPNQILAGLAYGEFLMRCARPPKGMPKGPKKKKKKKITIDNTTLKHQNFRASNKERNFIQYIVSLHRKLASHC